jgi:hypothetical protein
MTEQPAAASTAAARNENPIFSIVFNIALPAIILYKLSGPERLGPVWAFVVALSVPLGYGLMDLIRNRKANFYSILGIVSISLTGSFGLMHLDGFWFAVKDATIPGLMAVAVIASAWSKKPLVKTILYNERVIDVVLVDKELTTRGNVAEFNQLLTRTTLMLALSFMLSAVLNFTLALHLLKSPSGTVEFNQELGKMTAMSYPVIVLPCMVVTGFALWRLLSGIKRLTGLDLDTIFKSPPPKEKKA